MGNDGIEHGVSTTTVLVGFINTGRAAVVSTGTHMSSKILGTRGFLITVSITAMTTPSSFGRFLSHPTCHKSEFHSLTHNRSRIYT